MNKCLPFPAIYVAETNIEHVISKHSSKKEYS